MKMEFNKYQNKLGLKNKIARILWCFVQLTLFALTPSFCCNGWRCLLLRLFGAKVGKRVVIKSSVRIWAPWNLDVGSLCAIDKDVEIYNVNLVKLGCHTVVSQGAFLCAASHNVRSLDMELVSKPIETGEHVWICGRAMVLPGVKIADGAVVGAGCVVSRSIDAWTIVAGNPAKKIGLRNLMVVKR